MTTRRATPEHSTKRLMNESSCVPDQIGILREEPGCLPFTGANRSVHGLGKSYAKFRTGKCSLGISFTICTNRFHLPKNDREGLKLVSTMALK